MKKLKFWLWQLFGFFKKNPPIKIGQIPPIDLGIIEFIFPGIAQGSGTAIVKHDPMRIILDVNNGISEKTKNETMKELAKGAELILKNGPGKSRIHFWSVYLYASEPLANGSDRFYFSVLARKSEGDEIEWDYFKIEEGE